MSPKIPPASIQLAASATYIGLPSLQHQIYEHLRAVAQGMNGPWTCFPFSSADHPPDQMRSWPRMRDFRDSLVSGLPQAPPSDINECARIKQLLVREMSLIGPQFAQSSELKGDYLAVATSTIKNWESELIATPGRALTQADMRNYAYLEIRSRIAQMLQDDEANGHLIASRINGEAVVLLDDLVAWAIFREIKVEQDALPGCQPLVFASFQRVHAQLGREARLTARRDKAQTVSAEPKSEEPAQLQSSWKMRVQAEATARFLRLYEAGASPTVYSIKDDLARWCRDTGLMTASGIFPTGEYLRIHVLSRKYWQPPAKPKKTS